jgi:hypothetical protein
MTLNAVAESGRRENTAACAARCCVPTPPPDPGLVGHSFFGPKILDTTHFPPCAGSCAACARAWPL